MHYVVVQYNESPSSKFGDSNNESCTSQQKRKRHRNVIWFSPPYSKNIVTNIGKTFLQLIDKHCPQSSRLRKFFNRNSIKISCSCMKNVMDHKTKIKSTQPKKPTVTVAWKRSAPSKIMFDPGYRLSSQIK
jgi:hypothetical protein